MGRLETMIVAAAVAAGFAADFIFGDPVYRLHPARLMGLFVSKGERLLRCGGRRKTAAFLSGALLSLALVAASFAAPFFLLRFLYKLHFAAGFVTEVFFCYQIIAARALKDESMRVYSALGAGDTAGARLSLSYIVGRDTENLGIEKIVKAAVETVAENLSDGVVAPMIFMFIGGAPLGFAYKAVSTLDSMIGYKDGKYEYFGKFAARMDDVANFIPARISALLMIAASRFCGLDSAQSLRVYLRDRYKHKSPNSAHTESVCAGALGIELAGDSSYGGVSVKKPAIGNPLRPAVKEDIKLANRLMYATSWLALAVGAAARCLLYFL